MGTGFSRARSRPLRGKSAPSGAGLTLIEVLIALFIFGTGMAVVMQGLALGLKVRRDSAVTRQLSIVAANRLARLVADGGAPLREEGEEGPFHWRLESLPLGDEGSGELHEVKITVEAPSGRQWEITTLFPLSADES